MTSLARLAELHARHFISQQKHQDELSRQDHLAEQHRAAKRKLDADRWRQAAINSAGPLCILDAVGQAEESWVELFEHAPRCELPEPKTRSNWSGSSLKPQWA
ncbi:hypothetical protein [Halochromatium salexigens]|uniref:Uncharacterized protein n=1 Tax=Halochromatium salexigens TaxID=49447 RepID=A0AAJ0XFA3_HALSE|nr:hypothetical protein [Halochromatium salexigens]MBK5930103.1 hypothetical protein [Halochromatium salexigens]